MVIRVIRDGKRMKGGKQESNITMSTEEMKS